MRTNITSVHVRHCAHLPPRIGEMRIFDRIQAINKLLYDPSFIGGDAIYALQGATYVVGTVSLSTILSSMTGPADRLKHCRRLTKSDLLDRLKKQEFKMGSVHWSLIPTLTVLINKLGDMLQRSKPPLPMRSRVRSELGPFSSCLETALNVASSTDNLLSLLIENEGAIPLSLMILSQASLSCANTQRTPISTLPVILSVSAKALTVETTKRLSSLLDHLVLNISSQSHMLELIAQVFRCYQGKLKNTLLRSSKAAEALIKAATLKEPISSTALNSADAAIAAIVAICTSSKGEITDPDILDNFACTNLLQSISKRMYISIERGEDEAVGGHLWASALVSCFAQGGDEVHSSIVEAKVLPEFIRMIESSKGVWAGSPRYTAMLECILENSIHNRQIAEQSLRNGIGYLLNVYTSNRQAPQGAPRAAPVPNPSIDLNTAVQKSTQELTLPAMVEAAHQALIGVDTPATVFFRLRMCALDDPEAAFEVLQTILLMFSRPNWAAEIAHNTSYCNTIWNLSFPPLDTEIKGSAVSLPKLNEAARAVFECTRSHSNKGREMQLRERKTKVLASKSRGKVKRICSTYFNSTSTVGSTSSIYKGTHAE